MTLVYFGSDAFSARILAALLKSKLPIAAVVTAPDKPKGRSQRVAATPVKEILLQLAPKIPLLQPEKSSSPQFIESYAKLKPALGIVVSYGKLLKPPLLKIPTIGTINVHPSLLPKYRGPSPIQSAVLAGEKEVGVCIMEVDEGMDDGGIIAVEKMPLDEETTFGEAEAELCRRSEGLLCEVVRKILHEGCYEISPQDHAKATYTKKIFPEDAWIDFAQPVEKVHNLIRGMAPKPGARCYVQIGQKQLVCKIFRATIIGPEEQHMFDKESVLVGEVIAYDHQRGIVIKCQNGLLRLHTLQLEGKQKISAAEWVNGFSETIFLHSKSVNKIG